MARVAARERPQQAMRFDSAAQILIGQSIQRVVKGQEKIGNRNIVPIQPDRRRGFMQQSAPEPASSDRNRGGPQALIQSSQRNRRRQGDAGLFS